MDNRGQALESIENEIDKYKKLAGGAKIFGSGVELVVDGDITTAWIIDLVNELFNNGAEAVSVNGIRLVNNTMGFDTLPQGQILLNGSITPPPYTFEAIGEPRTIESALQLPGGILDRLQRNFEAVTVEVVAKDIIRMD